jgi:DNA-binding MarR family transcriptional regulator
MPKILLTEVPCSDEFLTGLKQLFPEVDAYSFYTYLTLRKVTSDLENTLESYFSSYGVSAGRFMLLLLLSANDSGMMPSELAQQCGVTQATISGLLNGLEKAQLIVRETHNHDGRAYVIKLSNQGLDLLNKVKPEFLKCVHNMMGEFSLEEKQGMVSSLARFSNCLKLMTELKTARLTASNG